VSAVAATDAPAAKRSGANLLPAWWPLGALVLLAAVLRFTTLDLQSFWYDEAYTPVHVFHDGPLGRRLARRSRHNREPRLRCGTRSRGSTYGCSAMARIALRLPSAIAGGAHGPGGMGDRGRARRDVARR